MYEVPLYTNPKLNIKESVIKVLQTLNGTSDKDIKNITRTAEYKQKDSQALEKVEAQKAFNAHLDELFKVPTNVEIANSKKSLSSYHMADEYCNMKIKLGNYDKEHFTRDFHDNTVVPDLIKNLEDMAYDCLNIQKRTAAISILNNFESTDGKVTVNLQKVLEEMTETLDTKRFNAEFFSEKNIEAAVKNASKVVSKEVEMEF